MTLITPAGALSLRPGALAAISLVLVLSAPSAEAGSLGRCTTAETPWPVVLPDGSVHEEKQLNICLSQELNPVTGLHRITVGKHAVGSYTSRIGRSEAPAGNDPVLVFYRNASNEHRLVGYAWPDGETMRTYRLVDPAGSSSELRRLARMPLLERPDAGEDLILIAAVRY